MRALLLLAVLAPGLAAQSMQTFTTVRQHHGESRLRASVEFGAGTLRLAPTPASESTLYRMSVTYDRERFAPASEFRASTGEVTLGLRSIGGTGLRVSSRKQLEQSAEILFATAVDLDLTATLGAVESDLDLGGLRLTSLSLRTGASQTVVAFSRPNPTRCRSARFAAGAAELRIESLGNARCREVSVEGGLGSLTLDLSGPWTGEAALSVRLTAGELTLRVPRDLGLRVTMGGFLATFDDAGFERRQGSHVTPGYDGLQRRLDVRLSAALGSIRVEWLDP